MKKFDDLINIRSIQHYLYCPHRWGLMELDCSWQTNEFVNKGNIIHENVENHSIIYKHNTILEKAVTVYNDEYRLYGVIDCLEFKKNKKGIYIEKYKDNYQISIIEYKVSYREKTGCRYEDKIQLLAQKVCVDKLFNCNSNTYIYYYNTKDRKEIVFDEKDYDFLKETILEIEQLLEKNTIPLIRVNQYCKYCSLKNICIPNK